MDACPEARLDRGLDLFALRKMTMVTIPRLAWALLVGHGHVSWPQAVYLHDRREIQLRCDEPMPVQVDGDYVGELTKVDLSLRRDALRLLV